MSNTYANLVGFFLGLQNTEDLRISRCIAFQDRYIPTGRSGYWYKEAQDVFNEIMSQYITSGTGLTI